MFLSPARGDISLSLAPATPGAQTDTAPYGAGSVPGRSPFPTACTVGQRTSPLPRLETVGVA
jgi:hypothetical protein